MSAIDTSVGSLQPAISQTEAPSLSLQRMAWIKFRRHRLAVVGAIVLVFLVIFAFGGALVYSEADANFNDTKNKLMAPSPIHPFGTDHIGRDVLARTIYGGQISLLIGLAAVLLEVVIGVLVGAMAGFYGGAIDSLLMRFTEAVFNIPQLFLLIVMAKYFAGKIPDLALLGRTFSSSVVVIILIIGLTSWMYLARIIRAEFLSLKARDFVLAARCTGVPTRRIIFQHILPNSVAPIIVSATLGIAAAILSESYISFLGLGVQPPTATWGNMLERSTKNIAEIGSAPWLWFFPGILIVLTVLSINFVGDGLRDALDPRSRTL
jgi:peptide/nickel transport system permease protein